MKRFQIIAPNGDECSAIWADKNKTILQSWSGKRFQWESFPVRFCMIDELCILDMATADNQIINKSINKIEFKDGTIFAREPRLNKYRKIIKPLF